MKDHGERQERRKKKKHEEKEKEVPQKHQEEKKDEKKAPVITMREKSAIKKTNVHKALKITTPDDSDGAFGPKENPAQEKEILVEKDQITGTERNDGGVQMDNTTLVEKNAPNPEKNDGSQTHLDNNDDVVTSNPFS
jgi:hypothetical protein